jgi:hypothetical protein
MGIFSWSGDRAFYEVSHRRAQARHRAHQPRPRDSPATRYNSLQPAFLAARRLGSVAHSETDEVNRGVATFGSGVMTIPDQRTPADGLGTQFRPLLEIQLGAYKPPLFLYAPNAQADWPSW